MTPGVIFDEHIKKLEEKLDTLETKIKDIQGEKVELQIKVDELEQNSKLKHLRLYGLPEENNGDLNTKILKMFQDKLKVTNIRIEQCFRIGKSSNGKSSKPRAVIIKFESMQERNTIFFNKKKLKNSKIVIAEELTYNRFQLLMLAKEKFGKENVWTVGGKIYTKINGKKKYLKTEDDITKNNN